MEKTIIMHRTALFAQSEMNKTDNFGRKATCEELIIGFNEGKHIVDKENRENSYSITTTN